MTTFMSVSQAASSTYSRSSSGVPSTMPTDTAATKSRIGERASGPARISHATASCAATKAPVIAAVRVPPSAWSTSQSSEIVRSPSAREVEHAAQRAADQALDLLRAAALLAARRLAVAARVRRRGSMPYSAVTQPSPLPRLCGGTFSSTDAVHSTLVSPNATSTEPSACRV